MLKLYLIVAQIYSPNKHLLFVRCLPKIIYNEEKKYFEIRSKCVKYSEWENIFSFWNTPKQSFYVNTFVSKNEGEMEIPSKFPLKEKWKFPEIPSPFSQYLFFFGVKDNLKQNKFNSYVKNDKTKLE